LLRVIKHTRIPVTIDIEDILAPTEVICEFLKTSFFVVAVFLWSNRAIIGINMHGEATSPPPKIGPLGVG
jgi:hypothetical protein